MGWISDLLGTTRNSFRIKLAIFSSSALTVARSIAIPDKPGTLAMTSDIIAGNLTDFSDAGSTFSDFFYTAGYVNGLAVSAGSVSLSNGINYIEVDTSGAVSVAFTGFTSGKFPLRQITVAASTIIGNLDKRRWLTPALGTLATQDGTFSGTSSGTNTGDQTLGSLGAEATANKNATGGYAGLTLFKINFKNAANTFTSFFTNANTAARTYTFKDADGTMAFTSDITGTNSNTNTGDETGARVAALLHEASAKTTLVDADEVNGTDSANSFSLIRTTWANVKVFLKTYFDPIYAAIAGSSSQAFAAAALTCTGMNGGGVPRVTLTAATTYYVRTDGSDSNTGLANTSGGAFLTIQKAINTVAALDLVTFNVTIQVGNGTYTSTVVVSAPWVGSGTVTILGDATTPANVVISTTSATCIKANGGARVSVSGLKLQTTTGGQCLWATNGSTISVSGKCDFGACAGGHMLADNQGTLNINASYNITGNAAKHVWAEAQGVLACVGFTATLTGTPAWSEFFAYCYGGYINVPVNTYTGSATGARYSVSLNGVINTNGAGSTYLPGNAAGSTATGGQYA